MRVFACLATALFAGSAGAVELIELIRDGALDDAGALIAAGTVDADLAESDGTTALHYAVEVGAEALVADLLDAGANAAARNRYGVDPIHIAALTGNSVIVQQLLTAGVSADSALPEGETALMAAARNGDVETLNVLLAAGASIDARENWKGQTALMWAAAADNAPAIRRLLAAGADRDAVSSGGEFTALIFAVRGGAIAAARELLDAGADVNATLQDGTSLLVLAATNAHYELADMLLERGADPNADAQGWTALHQIAWSRRWNMGFNLPGPAQTGDLDGLELVRRLIAAGADVDARQIEEPRDGNRNKLNRIGATAFLLSAKSCDLPLMRTLLEQGADSAIATENGTTPLMAAAGVGIWAPGENPGTHEECLAAVTLAYEAGAGDINAINDEGDTALHGAVYRGGATPVIEFLVERGARLDVVNDLGWMPVTAADGVEYTPAVLKRYPDAAALLRSYMSERGLPVPASTQPGAELR